jgi:hypothetical protein
MRLIQLVFDWRLSGHSCTSKGVHAEHKQLAQRSAKSRTTTLIWLPLC